LFFLIVNKLITAKESLFIITDLPLLNSQSIVLNLNIITTEIDLFLAGISKYIFLFPSLLVLLIRLIPLDKTIRRERIFAIVFFIFYPISRVDFNTARQKKIDLNDYTRYIIYYYDKKFG
jgi:hypothetical protein